MGMKLGNSRDSSVGIVTGYVLDEWGSRVRFPAGAGNFSLQHCIQTGSGAHPASYTMDSSISTVLPQIRFRGVVLHHKNL
jgi:hypothetical protein